MRERLYDGALALHKRLGYWLGQGFGGRHTLRAEAGAARRFLPSSGAIILDVGAHRGEWSRALLDIAGPQLASIYAFEPAPENHDFIRKIADPRLELVPLAASDNPGQLVLYSHVSGASISSVYRRKLDHYGMEFDKERPVECTTVDAFLSERNIERVDFLKLDVEGHEMKVLEGAQKSLTSGKIRALSFEFGGCNIDSRTYLRDFWFFLDDLGFAIYIINPLSGIHAIEKYHERQESFLTTNYIAVQS
ncbi:FkbM family methyltransferase [Rhodospirillaceae bacterium SYSU D60014]|uniref:FkbM family methyltransferase n=1 Tax=Virgifigura deserti TaxID=2268457 RepID=UPI000E667486